MGVLTREAILAVDDLPKELVPVPEWGGDVWVRTLSGKDRDAFELFVGNAHAAGKDPQNIRARLASMSICDESGARMFGDIDLIALGNKNGKALSRIVDACERLSGLGDKAIEDIEKNLPAAPRGGTGSE